MEKTTSKGGRKPFYDWPSLQDGEWHTFRHKKDATKGEKAFRCLPHSFVSLLITRAESDGFDMETRKPDLSTVEFCFTKKKAKRRKRAIA